jgi:hypothetical protein
MAEFTIAQWLYFIVVVSIVSGFAIAVLLDGE